MNSKFKAYTLFEVIISMVIMSVISLIVFVLFSSFLKQLNMHNETSIKTADYAFLKNNLKREFYFAESIESQQNTIHIKMNDSISISYLFKDAYIIKHFNNNVDTIPIKSSVIDKKINQKDYITQLQLELSLFGEPIPLVLNKQYNNAFKTNIFDK